MDEKDIAAAGMKVKQAPDIDSIKQVVGALIKNFVEEEKGNRVTDNNMTGLTVKLMGALDGQITMTPPEGQKG